jgi:hypothetical protein
MVISTITSDLTKLSLKFISNFPIFIKTNSGKGPGAFPPSQLEEISFLCHSVGQSNSEKLTVSQLVKKFHTFRGTREFIIQLHDPSIRAYH